MFITFASMSPHFISGPLSRAEQPSLGGQMVPLHGNFFANSVLQAL